MGRFHFSHDFRGGDNLSENHQKNDSKRHDSLVLVTGGAGFIGSHLVRRLLRDGYRVRVLDNYATGKRGNLEEVRAAVEMIEGSIADEETARRAVDGVAGVFHEAAIPSVPRSVSDPLGSNHDNVTGTLTLLIAARDAGVRRFVYAASSSAYGDTPTLPKVETMRPDPLSPYAVAKLAGEGYCRAFHRVYGLETVALRYFNIFGPRQDPLSLYAAVIPRFITALLEDREITIYGDGEQSRDFTYVDNAVEANLKALTAPGTAGEMCNVACGESFTLNQLVAALSEIMRVTPRVRYVERQPGDVLHSLADIGKARSLLGYEPQVSFHQGLERTVAYFRTLH
jgi:nucleoside-diphosphate-sugar epimerase